MEAVEEIDPVLEKIWDLHDKLSDAIHSISRTHFLHSVNSVLRTDSGRKKNGVLDNDENRNGFVFVKGFPVDDMAIREAKSLNAIRTALENLEDQLEFLHVSFLSIFVGFLFDFMSLLLFFLSFPLIFYIDYYSDLVVH